MSSLSGPHRYVVIGGGNGSGNHGDETMWLAAVESLRRLDPEGEVTTGAVEGWTSPLPSVKVLPLIHRSVRRMAVRPRNRVHVALQLAANMGSLDRGLRRCREIDAGAQIKPGLEQAWDDEIRGARALIFAGAGGMTDAHALHAVAGWGMLVAMARRHETPVAFLGQGVGPLYRSDIRSTLSRTLQNVSLFTTRDQGSAVLVRELAPSVPAIAAPDWAILADPTDPDRQLGARLTRDLVGTNPYVVLSLRSYPQASVSGRTVDSVAEEVIDIISEMGGHVMMVPTCVAESRSSDLAHMAALLERRGLRGGQKCHLLDERVSARVVRSIIGGSAGVFANRYHALVFGLAEGVPATGIAADEYYRRKMVGALGWYGETERVLEPASPIDRPMLEAGIDLEHRSRAQRSAVTQKLRALAEAPFLEWFGSLP